MKCPKCETTLSAIVYEGVDIETCPGCEGEWLDGGELKRIVRTVEETFSGEEIEKLDALNRNIFTITDSTPLIECPRCQGVRLNRFNYAASTGVVLDKCPECKGLWLDRDELEHVQILVEEWQKKLGENIDRYGQLLEKVKAKCEARIGGSADISRFGFINAILRRFV